MIQSIFILSPTGEVLIERHFRGVTPRSVCDYFWEKASISLNHHGGHSTITTGGRGIGIGGSANIGIGAVGGGGGGGGNSGNSSGYCYYDDPLPLYDSVPPIMEITIDDLDRSSTTNSNYAIDGTGHSSSNNNRHNNPQWNGNTSDKTTTQNNPNKTVFLFSILRDGLSYLAITHGEISPLLIIEFLHRIADIFVDYFGSPADESAIKDNFSTVYQLLEETLDHGWPLTTELNALQAMIRPPTVISKLQSVVTGGSNAVVSDALPSGTISNMPWRRAGVKHHNNEIYIDIIEEIDAIIDVLGNVISFDVGGSIQVQSNLSGIPDLLLTFKDPSIIDDCSFHPCVRYTRYESEQVLSFVPPDGNFILMRYRVRPAVLSGGFSPPISCMPQMIYGKDGGGSLNGKMDIKVSARSISTLFSMASKKGSSVIEDVTLTIPFPKIVKTANLSVTVGYVVYDEASKVAKWMIGNLDDKKRPHLTGSVSIEGNEKPEENPPLSISWKIPLSSMSGLSVGGLSVANESYRPYKGVRNIAKSGRFQVRYN
jgi:AP-3 complex subunit mu